MQAILNASAMHDEFVKEFLVSYGKVTTTPLLMMLKCLWHLDKKITISNPPV